MKILFVCTGNTCRSPMAAALMNKITQENDMDVTCSSAGIFAKAGDKASKHAIEAMKEYDLNISSHSATPLTESIIDDYDLILTMTDGHKAMISTHAPDKIFTICEYAGFNGEIADPYGGSLNEYKQTAEDIYDCLTDIAEKIYDLLEQQKNND